MVHLERLNNLSVPRTAFWVLKCLKYNNVYAKMSGPCSKYLSKLGEEGSEEIYGQTSLLYTLYLFLHYEMGLAKEVQCVIT